VREPLVRGEPFVIVGLFMVELNSLVPLALREV